MVVFFFRFFIGGSEDNWICIKGEWVKHGKPSYPKPLVSCGKNISLPKNKEDCLKQGGLWKKLGPDPFETCNKKTIDRGNLCHDGSECEGLCQANITQKQLQEGMRGKIFRGMGSCSVWRVELGCMGIVEMGKIKVLCID